MVHQSEFSPRTHNHVNRQRVGCLMDVHQAEFSPSTHNHVNRQSISSHITKPLPCWKCDTMARNGSIIGGIMQLAPDPSMSRMFDGIHARDAPIL
jgi:hypothetical protein